MDEVNALYMARRVMRRNLERAKDAQSICDSDLLRSIILETTMWLHDFDLPAPHYANASHTQHTLTIADEASDGDGPRKPGEG